MAGTYVLTDTINQSFAGIFKTANSGNDVVITPAAGLGRETRAQVSPITEQTLASVRSTPGVAEAAGGIFTPGDLPRRQSQTPDDRWRSCVRGRGRAQALRVVLPGQRPLSERRERSRDRRSDRRTGEPEDRPADDRRRLRAGQALHDRGHREVRRRTVLRRRGRGADDATRGPKGRGASRARSIRSTSPPSPASRRKRCATRIRAVLPRTVDVRTGEQQAAKSSSDLEDNLSFIRTFLLVFAYVSLFVGAFIIFNTFSITVAQRTTGVRPAAHARRLAQPRSCARSSPKG